jgi:K+-transporting ATPase ATPase C chain
MIRETISALAACLVTIVLCSAIYPVAVWAVASTAFPDQARGSLIERNGKVIGSKLIAQPFVSDKYFHPRPSAVDYKADATGGSNLGTKNPDLHTKVKDRAEALKATAANPVPVDLVTASGSGMDPDISPEGAYYQAPTVAKARNATLESVRALIDKHIDRSGEIIGAPARVNVLLLNLALDEQPLAQFVPDPVPSLTTAIQAQIATLSARVDGLSKQINAIPPRVSPGDVKALENRVDSLVRECAPLAGRVDAADRSLRSLKSAIAETRTALGTQK